LTPEESLKIPAITEALFRAYSTDHSKADAVATAWRSNSQAFELLLAYQTAKEASENCTPEMATAYAQAKVAVAGAVKDAAKLEWDGDLMKDVISSTCEEVTEKEQKLDEIARDLNMPSLLTTIVPELNFPVDFANELIGVRDSDARARLLAMPEDNCKRELALEKLALQKLALHNQGNQNPRPRKGIDVQSTKTILERYLNSFTSNSRKCLARKIDERDLIEHDGKKTDFKNAAFKSYAEFLAAPEA